MAGKTGLTVEKIDEMIDELERSKQDVQKLTGEVARLKMLIMEYQKMIWQKNCELYVLKKEGDK